MSDKNMRDKRFTLRVAAYLILIKKNKVLLLRRFNTGWEDGNYTLISGHLEGQEAVKKAIDNYHKNITFSEFGWGR